MNSDMFPRQRTDSSVPCSAIGSIRSVCILTASALCVVKRLSGSNYTVLLLVEESDMAERLRDCLLNYVRIVVKPLSLHRVKLSFALTTALWLTGGKNSKRENKLKFVKSAVNLLGEAAESIALIYVWGKRIAFAIWGRITQTGEAALLPIMGLIGRKLEKGFLRETTGHAFSVVSRVT